MKTPVIPALLVSLTLSVLGAAIAGWQLGGTREFFRITNIDAPHLLLAVLAAYASAGLAAVRLQILCRRLGHRVAHRHALRAHLMGLFGSAVTPGGSGGAPALALTLTMQGVERARAGAAALATVSSDVVFYAWSTPAALAVLYGVGVYPRTPLWTVLAAGASIVTLLYAYLLLFRMELLMPIMRFLLRGPLLRFRRRALRFSEDLLSASAALGMRSPAFGFLLQALTAATWIAMFAVLLLILAGLGVDMSPVVALAGQAIVTVIAAVFPTPGGSGFLELALSWLLAKQGSSTVVPTAVIAWRLLTYYVVFLLGPLFGGYLVVRTAMQRES